MFEMRKSFFLLLLLPAITACSVLNGDADDVTSATALPLYPNVEWSNPKPAVRAFEYGGKTVQVNGFEITAQSKQDSGEDLGYENASYTDDDFWFFYLGNDVLKNLGYTEVFAEEDKFDRQLAAFRNSDGRVLILSNLVEYAVSSELASDCPCTYHFAIFTNDERFKMQ